jgi:hypothetical protein
MKLPTAAAAATLYILCTAIRPFSFFFPYLLYWEKERKHDGLLFVYTSAIRVCVCCLGLLLFCFFFLFLPLSDLKVNSPRIYVVSRGAGKNRKEQVKASPKTRAQAIFSSADELYTPAAAVFLYYTFLRELIEPPRFFFYLKLTSSSSKRDFCF